LELFAFHRKEACFEAASSDSAGTPSLLHANFFQAAGASFGSSGPDFAFLRQGLLHLKQVII